VARKPEDNRGIDIAGWVNIMGAGCPNIRATECHSAVAWPVVVWENSYAP
jgi:hypothetical protein